jgi:hypothetical protein
MKHSDLAEIAANLIYKFMPSNEIVFDYGDDGDKFYIVLDGVCDILVPVLIKDDHPLTETEKKVKRNTLLALDTMNEKRVEAARHIS